MNELITSLLKLQTLDASLDGLRRAKADAAPRRAAVQEEQRLLIAAFEDSKKALAQALLDRKKFEGEVEAKEQAVRKHTGELNSVKSNDAYKALLSEIESAKAEKASIEDKILEVMESQDRLQKELKDREKTLDADKAALAAKASAIDDEEKRLDGEVAAKAAERDAFSGSLPPAAVHKYEAVRRGRPSFAPLSEVKDMACQGCRTRLTADVVNSVMKGKDAVSCENCSRILYIVPPQPAPAAAPAS